MILNIVMYRNIVINAFTTPTFTDIEPKKAAQQIERSIQLAADNGEVQKILPYRNLEMCELGTFDDQTGKFEIHEPVTILDCTSVVRPLLDKAYKDKEVAADGEH